MRARDLMLYVICVCIAAPLIITTGVFTSGPAGAGITLLGEWMVVSIVVGILMGGGVSVMGWSFKVPAVLSIYLGLYIGSAAMMETLTLQMLSPAGWETASVVAAAFAVLFAVVGVFGALEIAGGAHGPME